MRTVPVLALAAWLAAATVSSAAPPDETAIAQARQALDALWTKGFEGLRLRPETARVNAGRFEAGDPFVIGSLVHMRTGRLKETVKGRSWTMLPGAELPAGTPVYASTFGGAFDIDPSMSLKEIVQPRQAWCAVKRRSWNNVIDIGVCLFPKADGSAELYLSDGASNPMWVRQMDARTKQTVTRFPGVEEGPVSFGADLRHEMSLLRWDEASIWLQVHLNDGKRKRESTTLRWPLQPDGSALLPLAGGELRLTRPDRRAVLVEVVRAPTWRPAEPASEPAPAITPTT